MKITIIIKMIDLEQTMHPRMIMHRQSNSMPENENCNCDIIIFKKVHHTHRCTLVSHIVQHFFIDTHILRCYLIQQFFQFIKILLAQFKVLAFSTSKCFQSLSPKCFDCRRHVFVYHFLLFTVLFFVYLSLCN